MGQKMESAADGIGKKKDLKLTVPFWHSTEINTALIVREILTGASTVA